MSSDAHIHSRTRGALATLLAITAVLVLATGPLLPADAAGYNEGDPCEPGGHVLLIGGGTGDLQQTVVRDCSPEKTWTTTATYLSEKEVIFEKRGIDLNLKSYSKLDPFKDDYNISRAGERFPDPTGAIWYQLTSFVLDALSPKAQTVASRAAITPADSCVIYPVRSTDEEIRKYPGSHHLPPLPKPDGKTGTITYALASSLSAEQRTTVLDALSQYAEAQQGTKLPQLVPASPTSTEKPTITFRDGTTRFGTDRTAGETVSETTDIGRDGLTRWKTGSIYLTQDPAFLTETLAGHELLHVLGFQHTPSYLNAVGFAETTLNPELIGFIGTQTAGKFDGWNFDESNRISPAIDPCTKKGMSAADANY